MDPFNTRTVQDIPEQYRSLFDSYPQFNRVQSAVFPDLMGTDDSVVVTAPTGSGKTVLFELALVKLFNSCRDVTKIKAIYVAPVKALCSERFNDWNPKFQKLGLSSIEATGDSVDEIDLRNHQLILTTPEKWDSLTRRWRDNIAFINMVKLMCIDEVHLLSDQSRGPTLETIICRMKTTGSKIRFVAVSATIFNLEDLAKWLGDGNSPARMHKFGNEMRPVALKRVVKSYPQSRNQGAYAFDIHLSYNLKQVLVEYSEGKPALIFCSTRRGVVQTCQTLGGQLQFQFTAEQKNRLRETVARITENKLKELMMSGIGYHHAGMAMEDRRLVQEIFTSGFLPILVATTTLAMGVNLPAHLVVIKSTYQYIAGQICEYSDSSILQMVGRAGRPQFDSDATAVIMTRNEMATKYQNLLDCKEIMESSLHLNLAEHLNSEIVLHTITDLAVAMDWLHYTFLYQRALKNPKHYGLNNFRIDKELEMMVLREVNALERAELVSFANGMDVSPTPNGRLMSHYYLSLKTFELFQEISPKMTMPGLLTLLSSAHEFNGIQLRVNEKRVLNELNSSKTSETIRYNLDGKIKTREMKINCLAQAGIGCLAIHDAALHQEALRIVNLMERIVKCLIEYLSRKPHYLPFYNAVLLGKCLHSKLWENSRHIARQLERIGPALGACLVSCGKTSFQALIESHPCELERIVNRGPPMGSNLIDQSRRLPQYRLSVKINRESVLNATIVVDIEIENAALVSERSTAGKHHAVTVIVGDTNNRLLHQRRVPDSTLLKAGFSFSVFVSAPLPRKIFVKVISQQWVGIDIDHEEFVNHMTKDYLGEDFVETRPKVARKRTKKAADLAPPTSKVADALPQHLDEKKQRIEEAAVFDHGSFDLEPGFRQFDREIFNEDAEKSDPEMADYQLFGNPDNDPVIADHETETINSFKDYPDFGNFVDHHVKDSSENLLEPVGGYRRAFDDLQKFSYFDKNLIDNNLAEFLPTEPYDTPLIENSNTCYNTLKNTAESLFQESRKNDEENKSNSRQFMKSILKQLYPDSDYRQDENIFGNENVGPIQEKVADSRSLLKNSATWKITEIVEPFRPEPVTFELYDSQELLGKEPEPPEVAELSSSVAKKFETQIPSNQIEKRDSPEIPYYPKDVQWPTFRPEQQFKENIEPKKFMAAEAVAKPLKKLKSLKDFFPMVKAVKKLPNGVNDEKYSY